MYNMKRSNGTIIRNGCIKELSHELNKRRIITPDFIENCKKTRTNISSEAMAEMDRLYRESRK